MINFTSKANVLVILLILQRFASLFGGAAAFIGFWLAYQWDFPVGPIDVALLGIIYAAAFLVRKIIGVVSLRENGINGKHVQ